MVLTDCELIEAECIFLLIDNGIISHEICVKFMRFTEIQNPEMFALLEWMLRRWVLIRKNKFHLPKRIKKPQPINLSNLIDSNSS
jgi:hypothetical protein